MDGTTRGDAECQHRTSSIWKSVRPIANSARLWMEFVPIEAAAPDISASASSRRAAPRRLAAQLLATLRNIYTHFIAHRLDESLQRRRLWDLDMNDRKYTRTPRCNIMAIVYRLGDSINSRPFRYIVPTIGETLLNARPN